MNHVKISKLVSTIFITFGSEILYFQNVLSEKQNTSTLNQFISLLI